MNGADTLQTDQAQYLVRLFLGRGARILITVVIVLAFIRLMKIVSRKIIDYSQDDDHTTPSEREKRAETLAQVLMLTSEVFAVTIGLFMVLRELGMNITPLLTGAGIAGVALGLGAQSIVKDFLNGFFILMENQFRVGDIIGVDGHEGTVEKITLRTTMLRDVEGVLHIIPHGEIKSVRNETYGWSQVKLDVGVGYREDVGRVLDVLRRVGATMKEDPAWTAVLIEAPEVLGIEDLGDSRMTVRLLAKTAPLKKWDAARELRRRVKEAFDAAGIETPYPRQVVINLTDDGRGRPAAGR